MSTIVFHLWRSSTFHPQSIGDSDVHNGHSDFSDWRAGPTEYRSACRQCIDYDSIRVHLSRGMQRGDSEGERQFRQYPAICDVCWRLEIG